MTPDELEKACEGEGQVMLTLRKRANRQGYITLSCRGPRGDVVDERRDGWTTARFDKAAVRAWIAKRRGGGK